LLRVRRFFSMGRVAFFIMLSSSMSHLLIVNVRADEASTMYRRKTGCQGPGVKNGRKQLVLTAEISLIRIRDPV
jgi:heme exporter protein D